MMKIDFIIGSLKGGGAERVLVILADKLAEDGNQVRILTFDRMDAYSISPKIERIYLDEGALKPLKLRNFWNLYKYYSKLQKQLKPDVLLSFLPENSLVAIPIAKIFGLKVVCSEHINHYTSKSRIKNFTRKYLYPWANHITVLTEFDIPYYRKLKCEVSVMPNPCTFEPVKSISKNKSKTILAMGNLDRYHHKGFDNLIRFIAPILKNQKDWKLKILGQGETGMGLIQKYARAHGIEHQVELPGFTKDVATNLKDASIFILSSRFEGLPMVLLEAMSQGTTCIAYDCKTGPSDIITNGENGILVPDQDEARMKAELLRLINSPELRDSLAESGLHALDKFSIEAVVERWNKLLNHVIREK